MATIVIRSKYPLKGLKKLDETSQGCVRVPWSNSKMAESSRFYYMHYEAPAGTKEVFGVYGYDERDKPNASFSIRKVPSIENTYDVYNMQYI